MPAPTWTYVVFYLYTSKFIYNIQNIHIPKIVDS